MATLEQLESKGKVMRPYRYFSQDFKKKKVAELDKKQITVTEICKEYDVSYNAVYKWIYKYSVMRKKGIKMVIEAESDTAKIKSLRDHITQLEQLLGQKQFQIDFLEKQIEIASDRYGIELKKKLSGKPCAGSGNTEKDTATS